MVGYVRVSTEEQAKGGSLDSQGKAIAALCLQRGWPLKGICSDEGVSGDNDDRPGLKQALGVIESGEADVLMVDTIDRLSRNMLFTVTMIKKAEEEGWSLVTVNLQVDMATPMGKAIASIMAAFAQMWLDDHRERCRRGIEAAKKRGTKFGAKRLLDPQLEVLICELYKKGKKPAQIARHLNEAKLFTPFGKEWVPYRVQLVIKRNFPKYDKIKGY